MSSSTQPNANGAPKARTLEADIALLTALLGSDDPDADPENVDVAELLRKLDAAEGLADGVEERLDGIIGSLDGLLGDLEARQGAAVQEAEEEAGGGEGEQEEIPAAAPMQTDGADAGTKK